MIVSLFVWTRCSHYLYALRVVLGALSGALTPTVSLDVLRVSS